MAIRQSLASRISDIPNGAATSLKRGFLILSGMHVKDRYDFLDKIINLSIAGTSVYDASHVAEDLNLDVASARDAFNAASSVVGLLSDTDEEVESFLDATTDKIYDLAHKDIARELAQIVIKKRPELRRSLELYSLAAQTLPSLRACSLTVDLRPKFDKGRVVDAVAVALLHIDTDVEPEIYMQLTKTDIKFIQDRLAQALQEMEVAETIYSNKAQ